ncbi:hypothetical protein [Anaerocolumna xylanovorans]|uniref:HEAT repeat-containing protein n=1 Tax=Anaerocolumna xylanovorans DSM 12503 TaxID=1121345 RepID=A0A1M7Y3X2_9FIRM|nr:hypothetical protein [Anaerocolumna xylanovorans]SHO46881.1 hypothetical protein SAMN02745217_01322 [Anaerocolumna xylanovorans DSM 12503]
MNGVQNGVGMELKSSQEDLAKRGFASIEDIEKFSTLSREELIDLLHSDNAVFRTAAACNLSSRQGMITGELLKQLQIEQCLYTRIAICESLKKGDINTAEQMADYLGKIGNNQHKKLPGAVSKKKSYPLPRDIIARTIGSMDISVFPALVEVIKSNDISKISEALDAIGYMVFYHPQLATHQNAEVIVYVVEKYAENERILWKAMMSLSAFGLEECREVLLSFANDDTVVGLEARRSLDILKTKPL